MKIWYPDEIPPEKIPLNAVEREPVPTRVLNPNASETSYKLKQRSYRKTKLHFFSRGGFYPGTFIIVFFQSVFDSFHKVFMGKIITEVPV